MIRARTVLVAAVLWAASLLPSFAQSSPGWTYGYVPTVAQWNTAFSSKQDYLGSSPCLVVGCVFTGTISLVASTTSNAGINIAPGVAPSSPNNGDVWVTTAGLYVQINGATVGPIGSSSAFTSLAINGCVLGANNFCVAGGAAISGSVSSGPLGVTGATTITSASADALAVGPNGTTNPTLQVNASASSAATGLLITGAASGGQVSVSVISPATNEALNINAKGTGAINIGSVSTGNISIGTASTSQVNINSAEFILNGANTFSLVVGPNGLTNPSFQVDDSAATAATGLLIKSAAAGSGIAVSALSSGSNENLTIDAKGSGSVKVNSVGTGGFGFNVGSDATGDMYYRSSGGLLVRVPIGSNTNVLTISGGIPTWQAGSSAASVTVGTTAVNTGSNGFVLYDNAGILGNASITGPLQLTGGALSINGTFTAHGVLVSQTTSALTNTGTGTLGQYLAGNGGSADPTFKSGAWTLLNTLTASNSATLSDTTSLTSSYNEYEIEFENILPATANTQCELQVHSGGSFQATTYLSSFFFNSGSASGQSTSTTFIACSVNASNNTGVGLNGFIRVHVPSQSAAPKIFFGQFSAPRASNTNVDVSQTGGFWNGGNGAVDGFQILFSSGNITSGTIKIYGRL